MRAFFKYFAWGLIGLLLSFSFPALRVDALAIVLSYAFLGMEQKSGAWLLLLVLACAYSAFSLASPLAIATPLAVAALFFLALRRNLSFSTAGSRLLLLLAFWGFSFLFWSFRAVWFGGSIVLEGRDLLSLFSTLAVGLGLAPLLRLLSLRFAFLWRKLGGSARRVDLSRADWISARNGRMLRKPFGLEKGL